ncbi:unnamed protein product [Caenorhabditis auriculariae]|uniref:Protein kinase domain-containing protein n=1 Tax=Caenorhabditis auriculariae TaxID=2777116 RepID=A0A8S1HUR8_9PELO|nr:unnamed protein product [Caenorhabditis auriculariae]
MSVSSVSSSSQTSAVSEEEWSSIGAELLTLDLEKVLLPGLPLDCVGLFALKKPGDFCVTRSNRGIYYLSAMVPGDDPNKLDRVVHLQIEISRNEYGFRGMLFCRGSTVGKLLYNFHNSSLSVLSGVLDEDVIFRRLATRDWLHSSDIYESSRIISRKVVHSDLDFSYYSAEMLLKNGKQDVLLLTPTQMGECEFKKLMFEELRMAVVVRHRALPIRSPIGIVIDTPMIIHEDPKDRRGYTLEYFLDMYQLDLDLPLRIVLCGSICRVMSALHSFGMFHGGVLAKNFFVTEKKTSDGKVQLSVVFNGSEGLVRKGSAKPVRFLDYDIYAPEVAWTRSMTPESGVFNVGRLIARIVDPDLAESKHPAVTKLKGLIENTSRSEPSRRPTMDGVLLAVNQIQNLIGPTSTKYTLVLPTKPA